MRPNDIQHFLVQLDQAGMLHQIDQSVSAHLEIAAIVDRHCKTRARTKALLFNHVKGSLCPVAVNLFGSEQRMAISLGVDRLENIANRVKQGLASFKDIDSVSALETLVSNAAFATVIKESPPWLYADHTSEGLNLLPALQSWPEEGGRYLTLAQVFTSHPETNNQNCGIYRVQLVDSHTALLRCHPGSGGLSHMKAWHDLGQDMPVAIALGGPPALTWSASVPLPDMIQETDFLGFLTGQPVEMVISQRSGLVVPSTAEIVIEGDIRPGECLPEGPFGNHTGMYSEQHLAPVIRVKRLALRSPAVYPCTVVGPPPRENAQFGDLTNNVLLSLLQHDHPWVINVFMPSWGLFHKAAFVGLSSDCPTNLDSICHALLSSCLLRRSKICVLLNAGVDIENLDEVGWHVLNRMKQTQQGGTHIIDARLPTGTMAVEPSREVFEAVAKRWHEYGF
jgi:4-hydroxy-3-polyprenylbenzoate decarboxylase